MADVLELGLGGPKSIAVEGAVMSPGIGVGTGVGMGAGTRGVMGVVDGLGADEGVGVCNGVGVAATGVRDEPPASAVEVAVGEGRGVAVDPRTSLSSASTPTPKAAVIDTTRRAKPSSRIIMSRRLSSAESMWQLSPLSRGLLTAHFPVGSSGPE